MRTIIELVKNRTHYINLCSNLIGPFSEALRNTCSNNSFCELYEIIALASVLQCEVQSVYPYIDYRAEMKSMNAVYKPVEILTSSKGRVIIFWSSTEDEVSTRARPGNRGIWNPNHFVPLLRQHRSDQIASNRWFSTIPDVKYRTLWIEQLNKQYSSCLEPAKTDYKKQSSIIHTESRVFTAS